MNDSGFSLKQGSFEGPLDLLLSLVEERKLFVNEVSLADVTDDFIAYLEREGNVHMRETASFVLTASTLLLIKARSLLPQLSLTDEESSSIHDLEERLRQLADIHHKMALLAPLVSTAPLFARDYHADGRVVFAPPMNLRVLLFPQILIDLFARLPQFANAGAKTIVKAIVSLESVMQSLADRIEKGMGLSFKSLSNDTHTKEGRGHAIISFLALLELVKRGMVLAKQGNHWGDIQMESTTVATPRYGN